MEKQHQSSCQQPTVRSDGHTDSKTVYLQVSRPERPEQRSYGKQVNAHPCVLSAGVCEYTGLSPHGFPAGLRNKL